MATPSGEPGAGDPGQSSRKPQTEVLKLHRVMMSLATARPPENKAALFRMLYYLYAGVVHFFFLLGVTALTFGAILNTRDVVALLGSITDSFAVILTYTKMTVLRLKQPVINRLIHALESDFSITEDRIVEACRKNDERSERLSRKILQLFGSLVLSLDFTFFGMSVFAELVWHNNEAVAVTWYPIDVQASKATWWIHGGTLFAAVFYTGCTSVTFDTLVVALSLHFGGKLDNLSLLLGTLEDDCQAHSPERQRKLVSCVKMHQRLLRFGADMQLTCSSIALLQVLLSLVSLCLQGFRLTMTPPSPGILIPLFIYLLWLLSQLWLLCWSGQNITTKSESLVHTAARCDWAGTDRYFTGALRLLILRAQRPIVLSAANLVKLNYSSYMDIMKNSYSAYTCLLHTSRKNTH